jgi:hypothetical protein
MPKSLHEAAAFMLSAGHHLHWTIIFAVYQISRLRARKSVQDQEDYQ